MFPICCWFILTLWIFRISDKEGAGLKKFLHSMGAVLGLWILHVLLGCNQRRLEMALRQCHTAVQSPFYGRWAVSRALLTFWGKYCLPYAAGYFRLMFLPEFVSPDLVCLGSLCELEGYICLGVCLMSCLNTGDETFLKPAISTAWCHCSWQCQWVHPHWHFAQGPWYYFLGPSTTAMG